VDIQRKFVKWGRRNAVSRHFQAKGNKETIAAWRLGLEDILQVFNVCPVARMMPVANPPPLEGIRNNHRCNHSSRSP